MPSHILSLLQLQFSTLLPSALVLYQHYNKCSPQALAPRHPFPNMLEIQGDVFYLRTKVGKLQFFLKGFTEVMLVIYKFSLLFRRVRSVLHSPGGWKAIHGQLQLQQAGGPSAQARLSAPLAAHTGHSQNPDQHAGREPHAQVAAAAAARITA